MCVVFSIKLQLIHWIKLQVEGYYQGKFIVVGGCVQLIGTISIRKSKQFVVKTYFLCSMLYFGYLILLCAIKPPTYSKKVQKSE